MGFLRKLLPSVLPVVLSAAAFAGDYDAGGPRWPAYEVVGETIRFVTAYNVGDPSQTAGDPCISANGENICNAVGAGERRCAANFVPFGTLLHIDGFGFCRVTDRTNPRYRNRVDIAMKSGEIKKARHFGKKKLNVKILKRRPLRDFPSILTLAQSLLKNRAAVRANIWDTSGSHSMGTYSFFW